METLIYLAKVNLYWILFYACYWLLLRQHTFFRLNRFYLVGALLLSLILPSVHFVKEVQKIPAAMDTMVKTSDYLTSIPAPQQFDPTSLLMIFYAAGATFMLLKLLKGFYNLYRLINQGEHIKFDEYTLILLPEVRPESTGIGSFSFFNLMVVSNNDYEFHFDTILRHELVHLKQVHSLDILLIEVLKVFFWFNPVLWCYKFSMREVHEFLADEHAENKDSYAEFLVSYAQNTSAELITNHFFNPSLLKDRVKMIYKNRTSNWLLYRYLMIIPVIGFTILMTAGRVKLVVVSDDQVSTVLPDQTKQETKDKLNGPIILKEDIIPAKISVKNASKNRNAVNRQFAEKQDTLKSKKSAVTKFVNYRVIPVKLETVNTSVPTIEKLGAFFNNTVDLSQRDMQPLKTHYGASYYNNGAEPVKITYRYVKPFTKNDTIDLPK